jgi:hypothetical protein
MGVDAPGDDQQAAGVYVRAAPGHAAAELGDPAIPHPDVGYLLVPRSNDGPTAYHHVHVFIVARRISSAPAGERGVLADQPRRSTRGGPSGQIWTEIRCYAETWWAVLTPFLPASADFPLKHL